MSFYILASELGLVYLKDKIMDNIWMAGRMGSVPLPLSTILQVYSQSSAPCGLRKYACSSLTYRLMREVTPDTTTQQITDVLNQNADLLFDHLEMCRNVRGKGTLPEAVNPSKQVACMFHSHGRNERCFTGQR